MSQDKQQLLSTIREYYGRVVWTHKTHEKQRELCSSRARFDNWANVVLTTLTTLSVLISIPLGSVWGTVFATIVAAITTAFAVYRLSFSPEREAQAHRSAAKSLLNERDKLLLLIERTMAANADLDLIRKEFQSTVRRVSQIYSVAPDTSSKAFIQASKALKLTDEFTFSSEEIDKLLPSDLRQSP